VEIYDVVVAGSGGGALVAAYTAARAGLRTVVLEKAPVFGGMSAYSGACLWLPGNPVTAQVTDANTAEAAREYLRATIPDADRQAGYAGADAQLDAFTATSGELAGFLGQDPDLSFEYLFFPDYYDAPGRVPNGRGIGPKPLPGAELGDLLPRLRPTLAADRLGLPADRSTLTGGQALIGRLLLALSKLDNVDLRTGTPVESLLTETGTESGTDAGDGSTGAGIGTRVIGVVALTGGEPVEILARRGVVLGAGGFEANAELRKKWQDRDATWTNAPATHTGDAILAGQAIGARLAGLANGWWATNVVYPAGPGTTSLFVTGFRAGIFVNRSGRRFANEQLPYARLGQAIINETHRCDGEHALPVWWIFDDRFRRVPALPQAEPDRDAGRAAGLWHTADTIEDLAGQTGLPAAKLAATVDRFNGFAATGTDEDFGRGQDEFDQFFTGMFARPGHESADAGPNPCLVPVTRGPFHAVRLELGDLGTKGGLVTDTHARVLDASNRPIGGLYAVGNTAASPTGGVYPGPGVPLGTAMTFAYRAARHLSQG
jgi:3-oxosteroid 1-dehydrogenase